MQLLTPKPTHIITCPLILVVTLSNVSFNVVVQVEVEAGGSIDVPVLFKPSCVGSGDHKTHISFTSQQVTMFTERIPREHGNKCLLARGFA